MIDIAQIDPSKLDEFDTQQLREIARTLLSRTAHEIAWRDAKIDKLTFELAQLKRLKFDRSSEQMSVEQRVLFDEVVNGDIASIDEQLAALQATLPPKPEGEKKTPKRTALPERLPRLSTLSLMKYARYPSGSQSCSTSGNSRCCCGS